MPVIDWSKDIAVNIALCDVEHRRLFELLNKLYTAIMRRCTRGTLNHIVTDILASAERHFENEERLMRDYGYPAYEQHKGEHEKIARDVKSLAADFAGGNGIPKEDIALLPAKWLRDHIQVHDKEYTQYFNKRGVA